MSFIDKIKKLFEEDSEPKAEKLDIIPLNELSAKIKSIARDIEAKNQKLKLEIERRISLLDKEMSSSVESLKNVDLSKRKEYEKIKLAVQDNLNLYISHIRKLPNDLRKITERELADYFNKIFSILNEFSRISHMPYEKATYLIGREMDSARSSIRQFGQGISALAEQNKSLFEETKQARKLSSLNNELEESKKLDDDIRREISRLDKKIELLGNEAKAISHEIIDIRNSMDYRKEAEEKQGYLKKQEDLGRELQAVKQKMNFRALAKVFHHDKKKAQLIKDYSSNFKEALRADESLKIIDMAKDAQNLDVSSLGELRALLHLCPPFLKTERRISELEDKMKGLERESAAAKASIHEENKKLERIAKKQEKIIFELKDILARMNISLKDK